MKLRSIKYDVNNLNKWYSPETIPDNPRSILIYTKEGGVAEASYDTKHNCWTQFRWYCEMTPIAWRELPIYEL